MSGLRFILSRLLQVAVIVLCVSPAVSAQDPSGNVVITTNTNWPTATYNVTSLTVQGGAMLTVGGGSTVNVSGALVITENSSIVAQSINTTAQVNGTWQGAGVTFTAASASIDAGSSINADGQGYITDAGPGAGKYGNGGSYGGFGGYSLPGPVYGSAAMPVDLGSGGGKGQYIGSNGGGAIRLTVSGTLTLNGSISATGEMVEPARGGAGSGGSVYVTTNTLTGSGSFIANGGPNTDTSLSGSAAGGGGRVAVYSTDASGFTGFKTSTAAGGMYAGTLAGYAGQDGTVAFYGTSATDNSLSIYQAYSIPENANLQLASLTVANGATLTVGGGSTLNVSGALLVTANASIVAQSINTTAQVNAAWQGAGVTFTAGSVSIDAGSSITADGQGYITNAGPGAGTYGSGGSYGGLGGYSSPGPIYGSAAMPVDLGSGGGAAQYSGSNGGGAIRLIVSGTLALNGTISANGEMVEPARGGGGSGGAIYVTTGTLTGSGSFSANGGSNTNTALSGSAAGGGGRVAVYSSDSTGFSSFKTSTASGGTYAATTPGYAGAAGTIAFFDTSATNSNIAIYQAYAIPANSNVSYNNLTVSNGAALTIGGGASVALSGAATITGNSTVLVQSINNTVQVNAAWQGAGATISAASLTLDAGSSIIADNQGYITQQGPGASGSSSSGGSYGGLGGLGTTGGNPGPVYGSATAPVDLGSGGGNGENTGGGQGGGAIHFQIGGTFTDNGAISANGGSLTNSGYGGAGAGGSVYVQAATIAGSGTISANGGSNITPTGAAGGGGGGGRVSVVYTSNQGFSKSSISVTGGAGGGPNASDGTINFNQGATLNFIQPSKPAVHGSITVQWFNATGNPVTLSIAGPRSSTLYTGAATSYTWDTTQIPAGAYELRLTTVDSSGTTLQAFKDIVVNNGVQWFSGTLTANTHWTADNVYVLDADLIIPAGVTLLVDPGTVVKALPGVKIVVQSGGTLSAAGTSSAPVIFTTFDDFTAGGNTDFNQGQTLPSPGEWGGVQVLSGGTFISNAYTIIRYLQTSLTGTLSASMTLLPTQVYEISGTLTVPSGVTLTILPGSIVKFDGAGGIDAQPGSTVVANGTIAQPIYLTSINDSSMGGTSVAVPKAGDWNTIFIDGANASFQFVQMLYGGGPVSTNTGAMLETGHGATVTIANSTLAYSYNIALNTGLDGAGDTVTVVNTVFHDDQERAVVAFGGSTVHIVNDTFDSNLAGVENLGGAVDIANTVISNFSSSMYGGVGGSGFTSLVNNDVFTTVTGTQNYFSMADPTGTNGNISVNPVYMNGAQRDFRPTYGSPLIDAANGTVANYPSTDAFNDPRYNSPLVATKTGKPDTNGNYPDIGAFEFVQTAPSNLDLAVTNVQGPSAAVVGTQVQITWTVTNIGTGTAYGPWHDSVYLVTDPNTNPQAVLAGTFLGGSGVVLGPGGAYNATATVTVPGTTGGPHVWQVRTNVRGEIFEGANTANNTANSLGLVNVDLPQLVLGGSAVSGSFPAGTQSAYYKVIPAASQAVQIFLNTTASGDTAVQLFVGAGYVPTPQRYDYASTQFDSASPNVVIPAGSTQTFYITAYLQSASSVAVPFTISASLVQFSLTAVSPSTVVNGGTQTLTFTGGNFTANTLFSLVSSSSTTYAAKSVFLADSDHAYLTFDLTSVPAGTYVAQAVDGASAARLTNAVAITNPSADTQPAGVSSPVQVSLETPTTLRLGFPSTVTLHYTNTSNVDIPAPLIYVSSNTALSEVPPSCAGCNPAYAQQYANTSASGTVLGISDQGPAGILPAGASGSISFVAEAMGRTGNATFSATATFPDLVADQLLIATGCNQFSNRCDYKDKYGSYQLATDFCASLVPAGVSPAGFSRACMLLLNNAGYTYNNDVVAIGYITPSENGAFTHGRVTAQGFNSLLAADATALASAGTPEYDVQRLLSFELQKDGLQQFLTRYHLGAFGYGRSHDYDITAAIVGGIPTITYPDGGTRRFSTPSTTQTNTYLGAVGDYGVLTVNADGSYLLTENDGTTLHFPAPGSGVNGSSGVDVLTDRNGNKTTLAYSGALLQSATDPFGRVTQYQYDTRNHITQITDGAGRVTTYTYDKDFLISVMNALGETTLTWNEGGPTAPGYINDTCIATYCGSPISLTSIQYPDGSANNYTYDAAGRIVGSNSGTGVSQLTFTYNNDGSVTTTDALGKSATTAVNADGLPLAFTDALSNVTRVRLDGEGKIAAILTPLGESTSLSYDQRANVVGIEQPTSNYTSLAYIQDGLVSSLTDPAGNTYRFGHDANLNRSSVVDPSGAPITSTFDTHGDIVAQTNRRGQTTTYTYNNFGLLATKTSPTGVVTSYTYDNHQNVQTVTSPSGAIRFTYNSADQLTGVSNPDGTSLTYGYNTQGRKTSVTDFTGFTTTYSYDSAGRLSTISSGGATLVTLAYDADSRVLSRTFANGASTAYTYDAVGNILGIVHRGLSSNILSEYDYTYDADGRALTQKTPAGTITYSYDLNGQLTSINGPSTTAQYNYDIDGNRTTSVANGAASSWFVNNLNQYNQVNSSPFTYDLDGNLLSGNGVTYTYDEQNRLLTQTTPTDTWGYQYDALGSRNAVTHNGVTTRLLVDATSNGNVLAELSGTGTPQAHYIYGDQLTGSVQASGTQGFYNFDATGNTVLVTGPGGTVADSYSYLPFGEKNVNSSSIYNPFTYSGAYGVRDEGSGLYDMHLRAYNPALGRFQQQDPLDFSGGDTNLYRYADNHPVLTVDPQGTDFSAEDPYSLKDPYGGAAHVANYVSGFVPLSFSKTSSALAVFGLPSTLKSYVDNVSQGNVLYAIHDFTTATLTGAQIYLNHNPVATQALTKTIPGAALYSINTASVLDQGSQDAFGAFFDSYYAPPSPIVCGHCLTTPGPNQGVPVTSSLDPNGKITSGFGDNGYVPVDVPITYTVYFENQPSATAAAVKVTVTDQLATNLNWSTLQLNSIAFNNATLDIPGGPQTYVAQANVSTDPNPVSVAATLNPATGLLTLTIQSVDPITGKLPANPTAGFLPPNDAANAGVGSVTFSIAPKKGLANATQITNQANIVFDVNPAIATNTVINTLDITAPFSSVNPLPATTTSTSIPVSWSGTDPTGSGIASYNLYVSMDGGTYTLWLSATTATSATYTSALVGHTYTFYSLATNNVGTSQTASGTPQLTSVQGQQPAVTVTPASSVITDAQSLSVTIKVAGTAAIPTGSIVLSGGNYSSSATTLTSGAATIVIPAGALAAGMDTLLATYTPDGTGVETYASAAGSATVTVNSPNVQVSIGTSPTGEAFSVDGTTYTTTQTFMWSTGSTHTLATTSPQTAAGMQATFSSWSDGGAVSHTVTASSGTTSYTANFTLLAVPQASLSPASLTFTSPAGVTSPAQTVTLTNTSTGPLSVSSITLTGENASVFSQTNTCGTNVAAGANCTISIDLTPASAGSYAAMLTIADAAANSPQTVTLTGTGTAAPTFSLSATPARQTITSSQTATYTVIVTPNGGSFTSAVALTASGLPSGAAATFTPSSVIPGAAAATSTLTIRFASARSDNRPPRQFPNGAPIFAAVGLAVLTTYRRRRLLNIALLAALSVLTLAGIAGCGTGTPPGPVNYTVTLTGSSGSGQTASTTVVLTTQ